MSRLGQYLQTRGLITRDQLEEALSHQTVQGARLGTNLVELGFLSIDQLAECLADFHKVPLPQRKWLEKPQRAAAQRATKSLVERIRFIPLRLEGKVLHAAVLDPSNPSVLDDLRFATGCRVQPYVLPEIWMHDWLLELFKIPRGIRHVETRVQPPDPQNEVNADFAAHQGRGRAQGAAKAGRGAAPQAMPSDAPVPAIIPHIPHAPPNFETNAVAHASATSRTLPQAPIALPPAPTQATAKNAQSTAQSTATDARPLARLPKLPGQHVVSKLSDSAVQLPAELSLRESPVSNAQSVRPPPVVVRSLVDLPSIEDTSWGMAPPVAIEPSGSEPPASALRMSPPPSDLAQTFDDSSTSALRASEPPALPELYPVADVEPEGVLPALEPMAVARELSHWESALSLASDRERLIELSFSIAACFATRVALFTVHQGMVQGLRYIERGITRPVEGVLLALDTACMLADAATRNEALRIDPRARALDLRVCEILGDNEATEVALFPIAIKQRVVNVLYASNGAEPLGPIAFGALQLVAQEMGAAYGRLILSRKASATAG